MEVDSVLKDHKKQVKVRIIVSLFLTYAELMSNRP